VELDEKLWSQTQISVASWADCDDDDDETFVTGAQPHSLGCASSAHDVPPTQK
jgi:hypothetical protein